MGKPSGILGSCEFETVLYWAQAQFCCKSELRKHHQQVKNIINSVA